MGKLITLLPQRDFSPPANSCESILLLPSCYEARTTTGIPPRLIPQIALLNF